MSNRMGTNFFAADSGVSSMPAPTPASASGVPTLCGTSQAMPTINTQKPSASKAPGMMPAMNMRPIDSSASTP